MKKYPKDFREAVIELVHQGHSASSLARKYHMSVTAVTRWLKEAKTIDFKGKKISVKDYMKLLKEVKRLKEDNEILKAAAVLLGQR